MKLSPRQAVTVVFFVNGAMFASWSSRIPALSDRVHADPGALSLALLAPALGAVLIMPVVGRRLARHSSRGYSLAAAVGLALTLPLPALAHSVPALAASLFAVGVANSALDLSMNAQGVSVERSMKKPILSSLHAAFSVGGMTGAGLGALAADLKIAPIAHFSVAAVVLGLLGILACRAMIDDSHAATAGADADPPAPHVSFNKLPLRLILIGLACFTCFLAEGAASDWSAKLVNSDLGGSAALGALAYSAFSAAMATGRLIYDRLWLRWGTTGLLRRSGVLAAAGFAAGLAIGSPLSAILGFITLGLGLSGVVPTLFRSGSEQPDVATGPALAAVSTMGYAGLLAGPPIIGGIAQLSSLRLACGVLALAGVVVASLAAVTTLPSAANRHTQMGAPV